MYYKYSCCPNRYFLHLSKKEFLNAVSSTSETLEFRINTNSYNKSERRVKNKNKNKNCCNLSFLARLRQQKAAAPPAAPADGSAAAVATASGPAAAYAYHAPVQGPIHPPYSQAIRLRKENGGDP